MMTVGGATLLATIWETKFDVMPIMATIHAACSILVTLKVIPIAPSAILSM